MISLRALIGGLLSLLLVISVGLYAQNQRLTSRAAIAQHEVDSLRLAIERKEDALRADQTLLAVQRQELGNLTRKMKDLAGYAAASPDGSRECLSPRDTDELRSLWAD